MTIESSRRGEEELGEEIRVTSNPQAEPVDVFTRGTDVREGPEVGVGRTVSTVYRWRGPCSSGRRDVGVSCTSRVCTSGPAGRTSGHTTVPNHGSGPVSIRSRVGPSTVVSPPSSSHSRGRPRTPLPTPPPQAAVPLPPFEPAVRSLRQYRTQTRHLRV